MGDRVRTGPRTGIGRLAAPDPDLQPGTAYLAAFAFALAASQSAFDIDTQPLPLQLFMPLQLFFADLHSDVPLQEFTPVTVASVAASAATETLASPDVNNIAAAAAIAALDNLLICMIDSSICY